MKIRHVIIILTAGIIIIFTAQNTSPVLVSFLFWDFSLPFIVLFYLLLLTGFAIGKIHSGVRRRRKRHATTQVRYDDGTLTKDPKRKKRKKIGGREPGDGA